MRKLARKWVNPQYTERQNFIPTRDDSQPIDSQEQEELVRSFENSQAQQSLLWRSVFAGLLLSYIAFMLYSIYQQVYSPWELKYHAYFMHEVPSWSIIAADWAAILVCLIAVTGLLRASKSNRILLWISCFLGTLLAIFWLHHLKRLAQFRWDAIWLPLGPMSGAVFSLYVDHLLIESSEEVRKLRGYMYSYKAI